MKNQKAFFARNNLDFFKIETLRSVGKEDYAVILSFENDVCFSEISNITIKLSDELEYFRKQSKFVEISFAVAIAEGYGINNLSLPYTEEELALETDDIEGYIYATKQLIKSGTSNSMNINFYNIRNATLNNSKHKNIQNSNELIGKESLMLFSGGIDCTVATEHLRALGQKVTLVNFQYGQKNSIEEKYCLEHMKKKNYKVIELDLSSLYSNISFSSGLLSENIVLSDKNEELEYVPFRNTVFWSILLCLCEKMKIYNISSGSQQDDMISPDNSPKYYDKLSQFCATISKLKHIKIYPVLFEIGGKPEIIKRGRELNVDFSYCWTCHSKGKWQDGKPIQCGICSDCSTRYSAFLKLGLSDPLLYQSKPKLRKRWYCENRN